MYMSRRDSTDASTEERINEHIQLITALREIREKEEIEHHSTLESLKRSSKNSDQSGEQEGLYDCEKSAKEDGSHG